MWGEKEVDVAIKGNCEGSLWQWQCSILTVAMSSTLVHTMLWTFQMLPLGETGYTGFVCVSSYKCTWLHNYLNENFKKMCLIKCISHTKMLTSNATKFLLSSLSWWFVGYLLLLRIIFLLCKPYMTLITFRLLLQWLRFIILKSLLYFRMLPSYVTLICFFPDQEPFIELLAYILVHFWQYYYNKA